MVRNNRNQIHDGEYHHQSNGGRRHSSPESQYGSGNVENEDTRASPVFNNGHDKQETEKTESDLRDLHLRGESQRERQVKTPVSRTTNGGNVAFFAMNLKEVKTENNMLLGKASDHTGNALQSTLNFKPKRPLSRSTNQSKSSESDQIGVDCEDVENSSSRGCSSLDIDDDQSDLSSDYGMNMERSEKSISDITPSPSPELELPKIRGPSPIPLTTTLSAEIGTTRKRVDSSHSHGSSMCHDNLAFIAEESEPEDGGKDDSPDTSAPNDKPECNRKNTKRTISTEKVPSSTLCRIDTALSIENAQRVMLRDFRKEILLSVDHHDGISSSTFMRICKRKELLQKLFDLFDLKKEKQLNQHEWIEFLKLRLIGKGAHREDRRVDFVELVESVTYAVCGDDNVDFEKFRTIFGDKNVLTKFFRLIDRDSDAVVTAEQIMEFISQLSSSRSTSRLTKENILFLENLFREIVGDGNEIRKEDFKRIIPTKNEFFVDRVFDIFDEDGSGAISLHEFLDAMHQFAGQDADDKIRFLFKVYDVDGDGVIRCEELGKVIRACLAENGMKFSDTQTDELTRALFDDADVDGKGELTFEALKAQLKRHPGLLENMSIMLDQWLVPPEKPQKGASVMNWLKDMKPHQLTIRYMKNNYVYLIWRVIFFVANIALFSTRCWRFHEKNPNASTYLVLARGAGQCLNFNCTLIVVVMLRQCLTFLRSRGASAFLPIDQHIKFHKTTGILIFFFGVLHTVMHLINIYVGLMPSQEINSGNWTYMQFLFDPHTSNGDGLLRLGLIPGYAFNSGVVLMIVLTIMVIGSMPFVRRGGSFEWFYWTHLLYVVFWILLIIHAPNFWKWFIVPGIIFVIEQALRYYNWKMGRGRTCVSSGILLPSKVTHLVIRRPANFFFHPGDYVFVRIPKIAKFEWHPFTISSAPEQEDAIWLHIRACGEWTNRLYEYFEKEQEKLKSYSDNVARKRDNYKSITSSTKDAKTEHGFELVPSGEDQRKRHPTVGTADSIQSVDPTSSNSAMNDRSSNATEVCSSVETVNECDVMLRKNVPVVLRTQKPRLTSTKSLPNVHDRMKKRETKMQVYNAVPQFQRSLSVNEMENKEGPRTKARQTSSISSVRARRTTAASFKYMRNKPTVIALKTPSYEENQDEMCITTSATGVIGGRDQKFAEEGRLGNNNGEMDPQLDSEGNELHPILGTTNTKHGSLAIGRPLEIYLDGPYGAPSSHIFRAEHAVLIATGIGVTPFASILQSIMHRYWASRICCPNCDFAWCGEVPQSVLNLRKVDFFWINRDQRSFEWFVHLLSQLEIEQAESGAMERFLDMHMYITSALQRTDMKAVGLQLALDLLHEKEKRDLITGLKTRTNAGRPNWNKVFQQIAEQRKGKVTVFYCGPPALARTLKFKCDEFGFTFRKEIF